MPLAPLFLFLYLPSSEPFVNSFAVHRRQGGADESSTTGFVFVSQ